MSIANNVSNTLTTERVEQRLRERFPDAAFRRQDGEAVRDHTLFVPAARIVEIGTFLRDDPELDFAMLSWIAGVDWMPRDPRFEVVYGLLSLARNAQHAVGRGVLRPHVQRHGLSAHGTSPSWARAS